MQAEPSNIPPGTEKDSSSLSSSPKGPLGRLFDSTKALHGGLVVLVFLAGFIWVVTGFIDSRVRAALEEPQTLERVARMARPEMFIDHKGTVLVDNGAMDYIDDLKVTASDTFPILASKLIITPKKYMANPPLVTAIDSALLRTESERGNKLDWVINLDYGS